jgi:N-sulfoglucosamine sulfohydrolase
MSPLENPLRSLALLLTALIGLCGSAMAASPAPKPNILFVIADDWGFGHAGAYGCSWVKTPNFDRVAREGILFTNAYTPTAKCTPSRSCILTGRNPWQLGAAGNHNCLFPPEIHVFPEPLQAAGYFYASTGKVWGPGIARTAEGSPRNFTGTQFHRRVEKPSTSGISPNDYAGNFEQFLAQTESGKPWFFWCGGLEPHRPYEFGSGVRLGGKKLSDIDRVPAYWPDHETVRHDLLDYALEVEHFDKHLGRILELLEKNGALDNTLVVVTSDNGMPFPRVKGSAYENANHLPLAIRWPAGIQGSARTVTDYVSFADFAPTFLDAAGIPWNSTPLAQTSGKSLTDIFQSPKSGQVIPERDHVLLGRERNDLGRPSDTGYPVRGIVKNGVLFLENFEPSRWPACNPETGYMDTDGSPTKSLILEQHRADETSAPWAACFGMRPGLELYDLSKDSDCMINLADSAAHRALLKTLRTQLQAELKAAEDPRILGQGSLFDQYPSADEQKQNFYARFLKGELDAANWINRSDCEKPPRIAPVK